MPAIEGALFVEERKMKILEFIEEHRKATVVELCQQFKVSLGGGRTGSQWCRRTHKLGCRWTDKLRCSWT